MEGEFGVFDKGSFPSAGMLFCREGLLTLPRGCAICREWNHAGGSLVVQMKPLAGIGAVGGSVTRPYRYLKTPAPWGSWGFSV